MGKKKAIQEGKVTMPFKRFLGYGPGEDGQPVINEQQPIGARIYTMYIT
jgi:hypothetical protein